jgi:hypothetical protein
MDYSRGMRFVGCAGTGPEADARGVTVEPTVNIEMVNPSCGTPIAPFGGTIAMNSGDAQIAAALEKTRGS